MWYKEPNAVGVIRWRLHLRSASFRQKIPIGSHMRRSCWDGRFLSSRTMWTPLSRSVPVPGEIRRSHLEPEVDVYSLCARRRSKTGEQLERLIVFVKTDFGTNKENGCIITARWNGGKKCSGTQQRWGIRREAPCSKRRGLFQIGAAKTIRPLTISRFKRMKKRLLWRSSGVFPLFFRG